MATDTFHAGFVRKPANGGLAIVAYAGVFLGYTIIFVISLLTVGFLEIRQANMSDFNALIAVLEERDGYADGHLDDPLKRVQAEREFAYWASARVSTAGAYGCSVSVRFLASNPPLMTVRLFCYVPACYLFAFVLLRSPHR